MEEAPGRRFAKALAFAGLLLASVAVFSRAGDPVFDGSAGRPPRPEAVPAPAARGEALETRLWVVVKAPDRAARNKIAESGMSLDEVSADQVAGVATPQALARLRAQGLVIVRTRRLRDFRPEEFPAPDEAFHDYGEVEAELQSIAKAHPGLASLVKVGTSVQGRSMTAIRFNAGAKEDELSAKPGIAFLGTHHAREHLSTEIPLLLARWLADNAAKPEVQALLRARDVYIVPLVNPDGAEFDITPDKAQGYRWHRKNMQKNADGSLGVDLNRNYGYHWGEGGASTDPGSDTYRGPSAFSEPESRAVRDFVKARPNLRMLITYHTFSELILYPWSYTETPLDDGRALNAYKAMAEKMAAWTGYRAMQSSDLYVSSGDTSDWAWGAHKIFSFTFELTPRSMWDGGFYPGSAAIASTFEKNLKAALYLIEMSGDPYREVS